MSARRIPKNGNANPSMHVAAYTNSARQHKMKGAKKKGLVKKLNKEESTAIRILVTSHSTHPPARLPTTLRRRFYRLHSTYTVASAWCCGRTVGCRRRARLRRRCQSLG